MKSRSKPAILRKPERFPVENVLTGYDASRLLALGREFEQYHFVGCDFSDARLTNLRFDHCLFDCCNLASTHLAGTALQNVAFLNCKVLGVSFSACQELLFGVHFDQCQLRYASFGGKRLAGTRFVGCSLREADFTNVDLTEAVFQDCDLTGAVFHGSTLAGADFTTATGFRINPAANKLTGARFALTGLPGLLDEYGVVVV